MKFRIGDKVIINGNLFVSSNALKPSGSVKNKVTYITRISKGSLHPYNTTGDLGWMNESDIKLYENPVEKKEIEIELIDKDNLIEYIKNNPDKVLVMNGEQVKDVFGL